MVGWNLHKVLVQVQVSSGIKQTALVKKTRINKSIVAKLNQIDRQDRQAGKVRSTKHTILQETPLFLCADKGC